MKFVIKRDKKCSVLFNVGVTLMLLPIFGMLSGTAVSLGIYGANYQEFSIVDEPDRYWFTIYIELIVSFTMIALSYIRFPIYEAYYGKLLGYRERNKICFILLAYVLVPILAACLIVFIMYLADQLS